MTDAVEFEILLLKRKKTKRQIAQSLGISISTLYTKLANISDFKASEIYKLTDELQLSREERDKIFFAIK